MDLWDNHRIDREKNAMDYIRRCLKRVALESLGVSHPESDYTLILKFLVLLGIVGFFLSLPMHITPFPVHRKRGQRPAR